LRVRLSDFARFSRAASDRCFGASTRAMATPLRTYNMTGTHKRLSTKTPGVIQVHHEAELDKNFGLCAPTAVCLLALLLLGQVQRARVHSRDGE
jgi:hypothetical protein